MEPAHTVILKSSKAFNFVCVLLSQDTIRLQGGFTRTMVAGMACEGAVKVNKWINVPILPIVPIVPIVPCSCCSVCYLAPVKNCMAALDSVLCVSFACLCAPTALIQSAPVCLCSCHGDSCAWDSFCDCSWDDSGQHLICPSFRSVWIAGHL